MKRLILNYTDSIDDAGFHLDISGEESEIILMHILSLISKIDDCKKREKLSYYC